MPVCSGRLGPLKRSYPLISGNYVSGGTRHSILWKKGLAPYRTIYDEITAATETFGNDAIAFDRQNLFVLAVYAAGAPTYRVGKFSNDGGLTWTNSSITLSGGESIGYWKQVAYRESDQRLVVCGGASFESTAIGNKIIVSTDMGGSWQSASIEKPDGDYVTTLRDGARIAGVAYLPAVDKFVACGGAGASFLQGNTWISSDGLTWDLVVDRTGYTTGAEFLGMGCDGVNAVAFGHRQLTAGGNFRIAAMISDDGVNWTNIDSGIVIQNMFAAFVAGDGKGTWCVGMDNNARSQIALATGNSGNWSLVVDHSSNLLSYRGLKRFDGSFYAIREDGTVWRSAAGYDWQAMQVPTDQTYVPRAIAAER